MEAVSRAHAVRSASIHALVDGNERLAGLATVVFLDLNGRKTSCDDEEAFALVMGVAEGALEPAEITAWLSIGPVDA